MGLMKPRVSSYVDRGNELIAKGKTKQAMNLVSHGLQYYSERVIDSIDSAVEEVLKGNSVSFNERFNEIKNRKIADEIWDICYALQASLCSILNDEELDSTGAATAMNESLDEFTAVVKEAISKAH